jgi:hypothetical protein
MGMYHIATAAVTSGVSQNLIFDNIPQTYTHLQLRGVRRSSTSGALTYPAIYLNGDSASNYSHHVTIGDGGTICSYNVSNNSAIAGMDLPASGTTASSYSSWVVDIFDYRNTNKHKIVKYYQGFDANGSGKLFIGGGNWRSTAAVTRFETPTTDYMAGTTLSLYGMTSSITTGA